MTTNVAIKAAKEQAKSTIPPADADHYQIE
jgi:hypothetical protein